MFAFDTNLLVYAVDQNAGVRHKHALSILTSASRANAALTGQSIIEFLNVAVTKQRQPIEEMSRLVRSWLRMFRLILPGPAIMDQTLALMSRHRLSVWDAHMLATCAENDCVILLSEDLADGGRYGPVTVFNPFNPKNAITMAELLP